jgi:plasmid maintenance system antidote protein VapI
LIATVFDVSPDTWLNLQHEYDLYQVREKISKVDLNNIVKKVKTKNFHLV